jgi:hypothetical protein
MIHEWIGFRGKLLYTPESTEEEHGNHSQDKRYLDQHDVSCVVHPAANADCKISFFGRNDQISADCIVKETLSQMAAV